MVSPPATNTALADCGTWVGPYGILKSLVGVWSLNRSVDNGASMTGTATIAHQRDGQFQYCERGLLRLADGQTVESHRRYIFEELPDGFRVLFADSPPRLFHRIILDKTGPNLAGSGSHVCIEDRYDSRYQFRCDGTFVVEHVVRGPRKHYTISTRYLRRFRKIRAA
ncbi:MAG TPA: DUF6314 family protein [Stellaceae bacterium]|nr:DUF6314 family protein [Stellaceae bacterium]